MIEHRFFYLSKFKDISQAAVELDRLMLYEGFVVLCSVGKRNDVLLLRRILEDNPPPQMIQQPQVAQNSPAKSGKSQTKKKELMFPNAVYP